MTCVAALHFAVAAGNKPISEILLNSKANINAVAENNVTPLTLAIIQNQQDMITLLTSNGAREVPDSVHPRGLHYLVLSKTFAVDTFISKSSSPSAVYVFKKSFTDNAILEKIASSGTTLSDVNEFGETALHLAVKAGDINIASLLLCHENGKKLIQVGDNNGWTPVHLAASLVVSSQRNLHVVLFFYQK